MTWGKKIIYIFGTLELDDMIFFIRNFKALFCFLKLHILFGFLISPLQFFVNLVSMSKWISQNKSVLTMSDFYHTEIVRKSKRHEVFEHLKKTELLDKITYLEYGVYKGTTMKWWVENIQNTNSNFFGFDTFEGLPEAWGSYGKGAMTVNSQFPDIKDPRVLFIKGLFQDTLFGFIKNNTDVLNSRLVIHLDADLYSSTLFVLTMLAPYLKKDDIVIFDEFNVPNDEYRAFIDFQNAFYIKFKPLAASSNFYQLALKVI